MRSAGPGPRSRSCWDSCSGLSPPGRARACSCSRGSQSHTPSWPSQQSHFASGFRNILQEKIYILFWPPDLHLPVQLPCDQGTGLPPVPGVQGAAAQIVMLPWAKHVSENRKHNAASWYDQDFSHTLTQDTNSPCRACFHRRSCTLPESLGSRRWNPEINFTENSLLNCFSSKPDSSFCHFAKYLFLYK